MGRRKEGERPFSTHKPQGAISNGWALAVAPRSATSTYLQEEVADASQTVPAPQADTANEKLALTIGNRPYLLRQENGTHVTQGLLVPSLWEEEGEMRRRSVISKQGGKLSLKGRAGQKHSPVIVRDADEVHIRQELVRAQKKSHRGQPGHTRVYPCSTNTIVMMG